MTAELDRCPTCEDRDRLFEGLDKDASRAGVRAVFTPLGSEDESIRLSSASWYTFDGMRRRLSAAANPVASDS